MYITITLIKYHLISIDVLLIYCCIFVTVSAVPAQEATAAQSSSGGKTGNCTVCKKPISGHSLLSDCPRNQARQWAMTVDLFMSCLVMA